MAKKTKTRKYHVKLKERELKSGNKSLYLDIWYDGKRKYEFLKLYLINSKKESDKELNKQTSQLAENIRAKRQLEIQSNKFGFTSDFKLDTNFIEFFKSIVESRKKKETSGNYGNWASTLIHLTKYAGTKNTLRNIDEIFIEGFKQFLENKARTKSDTPLSKNTQSSYFNKLKAAINEAYDKRLIPDNPAKRVKSIKPEPTHRQYLTIEELRLLAKTDFRYPVMKNAFLFSCLTGLRWSDIIKLTWSKVYKHYEGYKIDFRQEKTKDFEYLDISQQARDYLGKRGNPNDKIFIGLKYSGWHNVWMQKWITGAGINKEITFHCGRHTFACIQLQMGTDIFTVSKLLGHSELKTTQIYAKIIDKMKQKAVNKIPDINL